MRTREWLIENAKAHIEIDLFIRKGGSLTKNFAWSVYRDESVTLKSGHKGHGLGLEDSEWEVVHKFKPENMEIFIRALCRRSHKAASRAGKKQTVNEPQPKPYRILSPERTNGFDLTGMVKGDTFMGCVECGVQVDKNTTTVNQCPVCTGGMRIYTVTESDLK